jgi:excisionase family DNA binding protein
LLGKGVDAADVHGVDGLPAMLTPGEIARILHVSPKTVTRWAVEGKLAAVVTPGGHRRYPVAGVLSFLGEMGFDYESATPPSARAGL